MKQQLNNLVMNPLYKEILELLFLLKNKGGMSINQEKDFYKIQFSSASNYPISFWFGENKEENKFFFSLGENFNVFYYEDLMNLETTKGFKNLIEKILKSIIVETTQMVDGKVQKKAIDIVYNDDIIDQYSYIFFLNLFRKKNVTISKYSAWL